MIAQRIEEINGQLPEHVRLIAVSKQHPDEAVMEAYTAGQRLFGENKVQELTGKYERLPKDVEWHFIGHLQTNKVRQIAPFVAMIHSVDSFRLLAEIDRQGGRCGRVIDCLLQMHIATEESKFGFSFGECSGMLDGGQWKELKHVRLCGMMGMASNTDDTQQIRQEFHALQQYFCEVKRTWFASAPHFKELSMGMTHDYLLAIEAGSTLVRVGSKIFGERNYL